jgi:hypothetical protein
MANAHTIGSTLWAMWESGDLHVSGWALDEIQLGQNRDEWFAFGVCPLCRAMVAAPRPADDPSHGDLHEHEAWHAATDYPVPDGLTGFLPEVWSAPGWVEALNLEG